VVPARLRPSSNGANLQRENRDTFQSDLTPGRSCNVWEARSERPLAKGVGKDARLSTGYAVRKPR